MAELNDLGYDDEEQEVESDEDQGEIDGILSTAQLRQIQNLVHHEQSHPLQVHDVFKLQSTLEYARLWWSAQALNRGVSLVVDLWIFEIYTATALMPLNPTQPQAADGPGDIGQQQGENGEVLVSELSSLFGLH